VLIFIFTDSVDGPVVEEGMETSFIIEEGMNFTLPVAVKANPAPDSSVLKLDGVTVTNDSNDPTTVELINVNRNQSGYYTLSISNNISTADFHFNLKVQCKYCTTSLKPIYHDMQFFHRLSNLC